MDASNKPNIKITLIMWFDLFNIFSQKKDKLHRDYP